MFVLDDGTIVGATFKDLEVDVDILLEFRIVESNRDFESVDMDRDLDGVPFTIRVDVVEEDIVDLALADVDRADMT